jgi:hypothetical protein
VGLAAFQRQHQSPGSNHVDRATFWCGAARLFKTNASPRFYFILQYVSSECTKFAQKLSSQLLSFANCNDLDGNLRGFVFENRLYDFFVKVVPTKESAGTKLRLASRLVISGLIFISLFLFLVFIFRHVARKPKSEC